MLWFILSTFVAGVVCQDFNPRPRSQRPNQTPSVVTPRISDAVIESAFVTAQQRVSTRRATEGTSSRSLPRGFSPEGVHNLLQAPNARSQDLENRQLIFEEAARILRDDEGLSLNEIRFGLPALQLRGRQSNQFQQECQRQFNETNCDATSPYRNIDGSCNNLENPHWGRAGACFPRLLSSVYGDGLSTIKNASSGRPLPNPRDITLALHSNVQRPTDTVSHMFMQFGQFVAHDITLTPFSRTITNEEIQCCPPTDTSHEQCEPIILRADDPFYSRFNQRCLNFVRSAPCPICATAPREQTNQITSFVDASHVYGSEDDIATGLRTRSGGLLIVTENAESGPLLPRSDDPNNDQCSLPAENQFCFRAGDQRVNQHPALTSLHTVFLRQHNRIARELSRINSRWDDERLYQEARRIIIAQMQMIVYSEFLPTMVGEERMNYFQLWVSNSGFTGYDPTTEPTLANEFSTAAYRFGHSMVNGFFAELSGDENDSDEGHNLRDIFLSPFELYRRRLEPFLTGLAEGRAQKFDRYMSPDVTNFLYRVGSNQTGLDLASFNIQRGRDHGIPGYTNYVEFCGGPSINSFSDLRNLMSTENVQILQRLYESVYDVDLFSGGLSETPRRGTIFGPTFTCIIGVQFYHLKYGDRFYFEHYGQTGSFTPAQLAEIRKTTLAKIICDSTSISQIQREVMKYPNTRNPKVLCRDLPDLDLSVWQG